MGTRKLRVFVASPFKGLEDERNALLEVFKQYADKVDVWGYENWKAGGGAPDLVSFRKSSQADFFFLILGGRYGSPAIHTGIGITEGEFDSFLYSHAAECCHEDKPTLFVFEKDPASIGPLESDVCSVDLEKFKTKVQRRFTSPTRFVNWKDLQRQVGDIIAALPSSVPEQEYHKVSIADFDFKVLGMGRWRQADIETKWSGCPCSVSLSKGCDYEKMLHYKPPPFLRNEMERHLEALWTKQHDLRWKDPQPSFKTTRIIERSSDRGSRLALEFCHSTWHQFLGTNQAASKDCEISKLLEKAGCELAHSPFSNNLGFAIAVIDSETETVYYSRRSLVSVHAGKKSTAVGTQLHAFDKRHLKKDGCPDIFRAAYRELWKEARISKPDIRDLYIAAWGVGTRTGTPELLFVCDSKRPLQNIEKDVVESLVPHHVEFDKQTMKHEGKNIALDYELLADLRTHSVDWEPESAVACCFALERLAPGCVVL